MEEKIREIRQMEEVLGLAMNLCQTEGSDIIIAVDPYRNYVHLTLDAFKKVFGIYETEPHSEGTVKHIKRIEGVEFITLEDKPQVEEDDDF